MSTTESVQPPWMTFDEVSAFLTLPEVEVARLLLAGVLRFKVEKRSRNPRYVLRADIHIASDDVRAHQEQRWSPRDVIKADELCNRAAMKFGHHPTRTGPGVRGPAKPKEAP